MSHMTRIIISDGKTSEGSGPGGNGICPFVPVTTRRAVLSEGVTGDDDGDDKEPGMPPMQVLHWAGTSAGCVLALVPALLPSARAARRWPHVVMALGMAAGHLGGLLHSAAVLALLAAGWLCGSPSRRTATGHHIQDFVVMSMLLVLTSFGAPALTGVPAGHHHGGGSAGGAALVIGLVWTCARLIRVLPAPNADRSTLGQDACAAGMAAGMALMAASAL